MTTHLYQVPHCAQQTMSGESTPLLGDAVPIFHELINSWKDTIAAASNLTPLLEPGLTWANLYAGRMNNTMAYAVAMCQYREFK